MFVQSLVEKTVNLSTARLLFTNRIKITRHRAANELILPGQRKHPQDIVKTFYIQTRSFRRVSNIFRNYKLLVISSDIHGVVYRVWSIGWSGHETGVRIDVRVGHQQNV